MFNATFYPTPENVARQMLDGIDFSYGDLVLDPSAGKGDLLDYISERHRRYYSDRVPLFACEIQPELRAILEDKGYPVLASDFLSYKPTMYFTKIVMNPPFDHAEDHIVHAFEILGHGEVISLIPTSSLEGKHSKERLLLDMIDQYGSVRDLGPVFKYAERPTPEPISVVILKKEEDPFHLDFDPVNDREYEFRFSDTPDTDLAVPGFIPGLVSSYVASMNAFDDYLKARMKIEKYLSGTYRSSDAEKDPIRAVDSGSPQDRYNGFVTRMNVLAWEKVLDHPAFQSILTDRARKMVAKFRGTQRHLEFNVENIKNMFEQIRSMAPKLLDAAIDDAFDEFTKYHKENRVHIEGWKTNVAWKVAPKVILPWCLDPTWPGREGVRVNYGKVDSLNDIDRAMCVVSGEPFSEILTIRQAIEGAPWGQLCYSTFFELRGYKKGTLHLKFRSKKILNEFNYRAARNRNWLPDGTEAIHNMPETE